MFTATGKIYSLSRYKQRIFWSGSALCTVCFRRYGERCSDRSKQRFEPSIRIYFALVAFIIFLILVKGAFQTKRMPAISHNLLIVFFPTYHADNVVINIYCVKILAIIFVPACTSLFKFFAHEFVRFVLLHGVICQRGLKGLESTEVIFNRKYAYSLVTGAVIPTPFPVQRCN